MIAGVLQSGNIAKTGSFFFCWRCDGLHSAARFESKTVSWSGKLLRYRCVNDNKQCYYKRSLDTEPQIINCLGAWHWPDFCFCWNFDNVCCSRLTRSFSLAKSGRKHHPVTRQICSKTSDRPMQFILIFLVLTHIYYVNVKGCKYQQIKSIDLKC